MGRGRERASTPGSGWQGTALEVQHSPQAAGMPTPAAINACVLVQAPHTCRCTWPWHCSSRY